MSGMFRYEYELNAAQLDKFIKLYKKDYPKVIVSPKPKDEMIYAFEKGAKELSWKYDEDDMVLYIDEPIRNFFFKKFLTKENIKYGDDNMSINEKEVKQLATEIMSEGCDRKKKVKVKKEGKWNELPIKERYALLSKVIFDTKDLTHIGAEVATLTEKISNQIVEQSDGDWFDKHTLKRNATEITRKGQEFHKSSAELKSVFERMQALYEEIGMLIERYL